MRSYDMVVVGTGPAGQRAAVQAAKLGASVVAIEQRPSIGGGVTNAGTIPSKTLREAVLYLTGFRKRGLYGLGYRVKDEVTLEDLTYQLDHVVGSEVAVMADQLARNGVEVLRGHARFTGLHTLRVTGDGTTTELRGETVVLAPGSVPAHSPNVPIDGEWVEDADLLYERRSIPKRAIIIGAGVIGIEYASIFGALGVAVTLFDQRTEILEFLDSAILEALRAEMTANGVTFQLGEEILGVEVAGGMVTARGASGTVIEADMLLYAVGRLGNTADLGLEAIGLEADARGRIAVDAHFQTALPHVYAVGDVIGFPALPASSMEQGRLAARYALGAPYQGAQGPLPIGIYAVPELSMVGMTEEQLMRDEVPYVVGLGLYAETARGQIVGDSRGRLKLLVHAETHELLGVHIIGEEATELVHIGQTVIGLGGRLEYLVDNVLDYPTLAETYKIAALDAFNKLTDAER